MTSEPPAMAVGPVRAALGVDIDCLPLGEELLRRLPLLARPARTLLLAAERNVELEARTLLVDFHDARMDLTSERKCMSEITRKDARRQSEWSVIRCRHCLGVAVDREQSGDGAEDLVPHDSRGRIQARDYGRPDEVAVSEVGGASSAGETLTSVSVRLIQVIEDTLELRR